MANTEPRPRILVTGGPTAEDIDPVRFITNRSTGRMGLELALAVRRAGGTPILILGPTALSVPEGVSVIHVRSAEEMLGAVAEHFAWCEALVMAAAVADYTPAEPLDFKLKKKDGDLTLRLKRTPDILSTVKQMPERASRTVVGFSLDVGVNLDEGRRKLKTKNLDAIVVNTTGSFGSDREEAWILSRGAEENCGNIDKSALADRIVAAIQRTKE
jgi:Phosphopantothenoylcysteine synthetase/decarboxylase